ncbi:CBS domain protein [Kushneria sinocarnis]|uniref:CBS domain protein n=1 Tax=Kushneria sinocarnis TaxID=595502 RepID=A0A420WYR7_9GAMM|nr:CBS domain-containing protein [Kushneria sinocarnis]RKR06281.1 CBS domain protein [Kushneria sinocarnis]
MDTQPESYTNLPLHTLDGVRDIRRPDTRAASASLDMDSPAIALLTDFSEVRAHTIAAGASASQAHETMKNNGIHMLLVLDDDGHFAGIVSARILFGGRAITLAMQQYEVNREDVTVEMIRTPREELHAIEYRRLERATLGDLVQTLRTSGDRHVLITDGDCDTSDCRIRGVVSASDVSHALGINLDHPPEAHSFSAIRSVVLGHDL